MLSAESTKIFFDLLKTSAQSMSIPDIDQVLEEVLLKLPVDVLLTFKCVSKQWLSIISHPAFGYLHFRGNPGMYFVAGFLFYHLSEPRNPRSAFIYLEGYKKAYPLRSLNFIGANPDIHRIWSCNGLLCLCVFTGGKCYTMNLHSIATPDVNAEFVYPWMGFVANVPDDNRNG
ncbi:F-box protein At5g07610-like [Coffea arabica]|uniref:F-box protein At5g07610-like n=1 Tax=Coffea arabica TaxID=13443 RepID=A0ABM4X6T8_COFAR